MTLVAHGVYEGVNYIISYDSQECIFKLTDSYGDTFKDSFEDDLLDMWKSMIKPVAKRSLRALKNKLGIQ